MYRKNTIILTHKRPTLWQEFKTLEHSKKGLRMQ